MKLMLAMICFYFALFQKQIVSVTSQTHQTEKSNWFNWTAKTTIETSTPYTPKRTTTTATTFKPTENPVKREWKLLLQNLMKNGQSEWMSVCDFPDESIQLKFFWDDFNLIYFILDLGQDGLSIFYRKPKLAQVDGGVRSRSLKFLNKCSFVCHSGFSTGSHIPIPPDHGENCVAASETFCRKLSTDSIKLTHVQMVFLIDKTYYYLLKKHSNYYSFSSERLPTIYNKGVKWPTDLKVLGQLHSDRIKAAIFIPSYNGHPSELLTLSYGIDSDVISKVDMKGKVTQLTTFVRTTDQIKHICLSKDKIDLELYHENKLFFPIYLFSEDRYSVLYHCQPCPKRKFLTPSHTMPLRALIRQVIDPCQTLMLDSLSYLETPKKYFSFYYQSSFIVMQVFSKDPQKYDASDFILIELWPYVLKEKRKINFAFNYLNNLSYVKNLETDFVYVEGVEFFKIRLQINEKHKAKLISRSKLILPMININKNWHLITGANFDNDKHLDLIFNINGDIWWQSFKLTRHQNFKGETLIHYRLGNYSTIQMNLPITLFFHTTYLNILIENQVFQFETNNPHDISWLAGSRKNKQEKIRCVRMHYDQFFGCTSDETKLKILQQNEWFNQFLDSGAATRLDRKILHECGWIGTGERTSEQASDPFGSAQIFRWNYSEEIYYQNYSDKVEAVHRKIRIDMKSLIKYGTIVGMILVSFSILWVGYMIIKKISSKFSKTKTVSQPPEFMAEIREKWDEYFQVAQKRRPRNAPGPYSSSTRAKVWKHAGRSRTTTTTTTSKESTRSTSTGHSRTKRSKMKNRKKKLRKK